MEQREPFDYKRLANHLTQSHFTVCRRADELIYSTWNAQFRVLSKREELSSWTPEQAGSYFYWPTMGISAKPTTGTGEEAWKRYESASAVHSLALTHERTEEILTKRVFLAAEGRKVFVSIDLLNVFSSSLQTLRQYYLFELLEGERIRVRFSHDGTDWQAIAVLML